MAYYLIRYSLGRNGTYLYPESIKGVAWKLAIYHYTEQGMVGETDAKVETDGKHVVSLNSNKAKKLIEEYRSSYPKPQNLPEPFRMPPE